MLLYYVNDETYLISSSSLQPHFFAHPPSPPPADRRLRAAFLDGAPSLRHAGEWAWEGATATVVIGHAATDECDGLSPLRPSSSTPSPPPRRRRWRRIAVTLIEIML